eukprot:2798859-Pleurochrysis_carterae.AAC.2
MGLLRLQASRRCAPRGRSGARAVFALKPAIASLLPGQPARLFCPDTATSLPDLGGPPQVRVSVHASSLHLVIMLASFGGLSEGGSTRRQCACLVRASSRLPSRVFAGKEYSCILV